jgi:hypothetical protein
MSKLFGIIILLLTISFGTYTWWQQTGVDAAVTLKNSPTTNGLVGYWNLDEGSGTQAGDASGQGNTGTLVNGPTWVDGKLGKALSFGGVDDYVYTTTNYGNASSLKTITLSVWFKTSVSSGHKIIGLENDRTGNSSTEFDRDIYIGTDGKVYFRIYDNSGNKYTTSSKTYTDGNWHHAVGVSTGDNGVIRLYVDGVLQAETAIGLMYTSYPSSYWRFGSYAYTSVTNASSGFFSGGVDEVRIYNRALSQTEITTLYQSGATKINAYQKTAATDGLVGLWSFDGADISGTTAYDRSGSGNNGTLTNGPTKTIGKVGQGLQFDTGAALVSVNNSASLNNWSAQTISFWIKYNAGIPIFDARVIEKGDNSEWTLTTNSSQNGGGVGQVTVVKLAASSPNLFSTAALNDSNWHHVVVTISSTSPATVTGYVDGTYINSASSAQPTTKTGNIVMGYGNSDTCHCSLDEVRIYNRALSADEITALYQTGAVKINASQNNNLTNGLVGLWSFDGPDLSGTTAYDRSGQGNNGTLTNGPTPTIGKVGQALQFDGVDDYVLSNLNKTTIGNNLSISLWIKPTGGQSVKGIMQIAADLNSQNPWILLRRDPTTIDWYLGGNYNISQTLSDNEVYHIVLTYDGTTWRAYKNSIADGTYVGGIGGNPGTFTWFGNGYDGYYKGSLDETRIYNRALSAAEVKQLYDLGR